MTLTPLQMPAHSHNLTATSAEASLVSPTGNLPATKSRVALYGAGPADTAMSPSAIMQAGGSQPHDNMPPFLTVKCYIALQGIFPSRN